MPQGYATANLLHEVNKHAADPWHDSENEIMEEAHRAQDERNPEGRLLFQGALMLVAGIGMLALALRDVEVRKRAEEEMLARTYAPVQEVCEHMVLANTPYTFTACRTKDGTGKVIYRREGF